jgi:O-acetyl-ADP-ribose deacetylase (regulator of RNase III)
MAGETNRDAFKPSFKDKESVDFVLDTNSGKIVFSGVFRLPTELNTRELNKQLRVALDAPLRFALVVPSNDGYEYIGKVSMRVPSVYTFKNVDDNVLMVPSKDDIGIEVFASTFQKEVYMKLGSGTSFKEAEDYATSRTFCGGKVGVPLGHALLTDSGDLEIMRIDGIIHVNIMNLKGKLETPTNDMVRISVINSLVAAEEKQYESVGFVLMGVMGSNCWGMTPTDSIRAIAEGTIAYFNNVGNSNIKQISISLPPYEPSPTHIDTVGRMLGGILRDSAIKESSKPV